MGIMESKQLKNYGYRKKNHNNSDNHGNKDKKHGNRCRFVHYTK